MVAAIKTKKLSKHFMGVKAVDELTIEIPKGVATGLIGPNGSGKTTLINVLTGLLKPESGSIKFYGKDKEYTGIKPTNLRRMKIARTFQDSRLVEQITVEDNLLLAIAENGYCKGLFELDSKKYQDRLDKVLEMTKLTEHRHKNAEDLSYGLRKLLDVGRALIQEADIYFFDEPFTGLFPEVVEHVLSILQGLKKAGKTVVMIEHNMGLIERLCDYTIVLDYGHLLAEGTPKEVLKNKAVREAYLGM